MTVRTFDPPMPSGPLTLSYADQEDFGSSQGPWSSGSARPVGPCLMSENYQEHPHDLGPHQHAHAAPTTQQMRTVGQRRRDAEEKLEHHLDEARQKAEHHDAAEQDTETGNAGAPGLNGGDVAAIQNDERLTAADRVDLIANQVVPEPNDDRASQTGHEDQRP